jgi:hypothetical protein
LLSATESCSRTSSVRQQSGINPHKNIADHP